MFSPDYLAEPLTPYPLPTKDGGRELRDHWKPAYRLLVHGDGAAPLTLQVYVALLKDGQLDVEELKRTTALGGGDETGN
jgi:hypothetical protein